MGQICIDPVVANFAEFTYRPILLLLWNLVDKEILWYLYHTGYRRNETILIRNQWQQFWNNLNIATEWWRFLSMRTVLKWCFSCFGISLKAPVAVDITLAFFCHSRSISICSSLRFMIYFSSFSSTLLSSIQPFFLSFLLTVVKSGFIIR